MALFNAKRRPKTGDASIYDTDLGPIALSGCVIGHLGEERALREAIAAKLRKKLGGNG